MRILVDLKCTVCAEIVEDFVQTGEVALPPCPKCGGETVRQMAAPQPQFKGKGFHCTDYGRHGRKTDERRKP